MKKNRNSRIPVLEIIFSSILLFFFAALLLPTPCGGARENARRASCQSNLKQIALGIMQYTQDNDERFPLTATINTSAGTFGLQHITSWRTAVHPYIKSKEVYQCLENPIRKFNSPFDGFPLSYDVTDTGPIRMNRSISLADVPLSSETFLIVEENSNTPQTQQVGIPWDEDSGESGWTNILYSGHLGGTNYAFVDGHVKWMQPMRTIEYGINRWHINTRDPVTPRARGKLKAAEKNF